jgi:hypothetical protein
MRTHPNARLCIPGFSCDAILLLASLLTPQNADKRSGDFFTVMSIAPPQADVPASGDTSVALTTNANVSTLRRMQGLQRQHTERSTHHG